MHRARSSHARVAIPAYCFDLGQEQLNCRRHYNKHSKARTNHANFVIVAAFVVLAVALFWGEYQTRHLTRDLKARSDRAGNSTGETVVHVSFDQTTAAVRARPDREAA
jgi:hypothetical protein